MKKPPVRTLNKIGLFSTRRNLNHNPPTIEPLRNQGPSYSAGSSLSIAFMIRPFNSRLGRVILYTSGELNVASNRAELPEPTPLPKSASSYRGDDTTFSLFSRTSSRKSAARSLIAVTSSRWPKASSHRRISGSTLNARAIPTFVSCHRQFMGIGIVEPSKSQFIEPVSGPIELFLLAELKDFQTNPRIF